MIERLFHLTAHRTTVRTEIVAGVTTFLAMAYIIFVQPAVLGAAGMDFGAVMVATCVASAIATLLMGLLANYPIAVAPAMGHNFYFAFTVCVGDAGAVADCARRGRDRRSAVHPHRHGRVARAPDRGDPGVAEACDRGRHRPARRLDRVAMGRADRRLARDAGDTRPALGDLRRC